MTVSTETVRMVKSRPRKNQSKRSDLPCRIINGINSHLNYDLISLIELITEWITQCFLYNKVHNLCLTQRLLDLACPNRLYFWVLK